MKAGLKRIEETLQDLDIRITNPLNENAEADGLNQQSLSFRIQDRASESNQELTELSSEELLENNPSQEVLEDLSEDNSVQTFSAQDEEIKAPSLPKFKTPSFSSHRNAPNPALASNVLQEIQEIVAGWQTELYKILRQIQDIYSQGPIVNGWLESHEKEPQPEATATLRHAEVDRLMDYVEEICAAQETPNPSDFSRTGYRLCGLDASGEVWSRSCPAEEVPGVSMAIARYQKLRQYLERKQKLENRLNQLAETLVVLHGHIKQQK
ncbi:hypothetical protein Riv7116_5375 [Rivularia sp. PCC 7116]|uniref:hypothetical protein n=1 Tax=Rivularia sp. PCC 7116 TaxID=373994 RepID=UPI00029F0D23|nr:hypothetical protein [Rivularia sp. PCC 7116]AFY57754.1 hypothetical protein Riv7116_5375 [Rivularia sp. PCC 7116]